jgi:hypothetical protein
LVTRVTPGAFSPATSSYIITGSDAQALLAANTSPFELETLSHGDIMNSTGSSGPEGPNGIPYNQDHLIILDGKLYLQIHHQVYFHY